MNLNYKEILNKNRTGQIFWPIVLPNLFLIICFVLSSLNYIDTMATQLLFLMSILNGTFSAYLFINSNKIVHIQKSKNREKELEKHIENHKKLITILCHDLDNSMTVISICSSLIETGIRSGQSLNHAKSFYKIKRAMKNQSDIIDNIKQKVAMDSGKNVIELTPIDLVCSINNVLTMFEKSTEGHNIAIKFNYDKQEDYYILAEEVSLNNYILSNIISNAIKFSNDNSMVEINLNFNNENIDLEIIDQGIGIPKEILDNIFDFYIKTNRTGLRGEKGTGFGLPLTKSFMNEYGGKIAVSSQEGSGSKFTLSFRLYSQDDFLALAA